MVVKLGLGLESENCGNFDFIKTHVAFLIFRTPIMKFNLRLRFACSLLNGRLGCVKMDNGVFATMFTDLCNYNLAAPDA